VRGEEPLADPDPEHRIEDERGPLVVAGEVDLELALDPRRAGDDGEDAEDLRPAFLRAGDLGEARDESLQLRE
jgi:hypothetical protein